MVSAIPPVIALALDESHRRPIEQLERLTKDKGFRKDLEDQIGASGEFYVNGSERLEGDFNVYAAGGLTPFSGSAKCCNISCRIDHAVAFARSTCLYAETVIAPDGFSTRLPVLTSQDLLIEIAVLRILEPLIRTGVIRFAPSVSGYCPSCRQAITGAFDTVEDDLWSQIGGTFEFQLEDHGRGRRKLSVSSPFYKSDGQAITYYIQSTARDRRSLPLDRWIKGREARPLIGRYEDQLRDQLRGYVSELLFDVGHATPAGAVIGTNYRLGAAALRVLDQRRFPGNSVNEWETLRSVQLPWIKGLNAADIVRLREEASPALPAFRRRLQKELESGADDRSDDMAARRLATDLRQEAIELAEKLRAVQKSQVRRVPNLFAGLGFAVGIYGLGGGDPNAALAGLGVFAANIAVAHEMQTSQSHKLADLKRQPAYVLLTARRLHRPH